MGNKFSNNEPKSTIDPSVTIALNDSNPTRSVTSKINEPYMALIHRSTPSGTGGLKTFAIADHATLLSAESDENVTKQSQCIVECNSLEKSVTDLNQSNFESVFLENSVNEQSFGDFKLESVFVDKRLLKKVNMDMDPDREPDKNSEAKEFVEFELYAEENRGDDDGAYGDSAEDAKMNIVTQKLPNGYIINSNVFLPHENYHCIVNNNCVICDEKCDVKEHLDDTVHDKKLKECMPLKKFDLSIIRKIRTSTLSIYHCGVCNETIEDDVALHFESKTHENNLLFAINKASDVMYDFDVHKKATDSYHFNVNKIVETGNYFTDSTKTTHSYNDYINDDNDNYGNDNDHNNNENDDLEYDNDSPRPHSYASMARTPKIEKPVYINVDIDGKKIQVKFECYNMVTNIGANRFYCMVCKIDDAIRSKGEHCNSAVHVENIKNWTLVPEYRDLFIRNSNDASLYHCGLCNNLQVRIDIVSHLESRHPKEFENFNTKTQNLLKNDKANDENVLNNNNAYDGNMGKNADNSARLPNNMPRTNADFANSARNMARNDYLNNFNKMGKLDNPARIPNNKAKNVVDQNVNNTAKNEKNIMNLPKSSKPDYKAMLRILPDAKFDILRYNVSFEIFNETVTMSLKAFFIIFSHYDSSKEGMVITWSCGLCNTSLETSHIQDHLVDDNHLRLLELCPFVQCLGFNMIRVMLNRFYCALCNRVIEKTELNKHIKDFSHEETVKYLFNSSNDIDSVRTFHLKVTSKDITTNIYDEYVRSVVHSNILDRAFVVVKNMTWKIENVSIEQDSEVIGNSITDQSDIDNLTAEQSDIDNLTVDQSDIDNLTADQSSDSILDPTFDINEQIYLKFKKSYASVFATSYHTLMPIDNRKHCFVCDETVYPDILIKHVESRLHAENLQKLNFVDKYGSHFVRQIFLMYHCAICNTILPKSYLSKHLNNTLHTTLRNDAITKKLPANADCIEIKIQKEEIYLKHTEIPSTILFNVKIIPNRKNTLKENEKNNHKLVFYQNNVVKLSWEAYHGITSADDDVKICLFCQVSFADSMTHVKSTKHKESLVNKEFIAKFGVNLLRKIDFTTVHCAICNTQLNSTTAMIEEHLRGKIHVANLEKITKSSSESDKYDDCDKEAIFVE